MKYLMSDSNDPEADPHILQAHCEMAAWVYLRPITWRLELKDGLPTFSDFVDLRTDIDGHEHLIVRDGDPSAWAYCLVLVAGHPNYELCGWLWGHEAKQPRFKKVGPSGWPTFFVPHDRGILRPPETLIDELIRRPLVTGRAEDGRSPEFGRALAARTKNPECRIVEPPHLHRRISVMPRLFAAPKEADLDAIPSPAHHVWRGGFDIG
jgi:hypothetical protein